jgi:DNA-directed RNA polymerase specialized sigma subunit
MITTDYIRNLLENINENQYNIRHCRARLIDSEKEIIEALTLPAPVFGDRIQAPKSETITAILERIPIELRKQRYEASCTAAINEAQSLEMEHLLYAISCLDGKVQQVIRRRYVDRVKVADLANELGTVSRTVVNLTNQGIKDITGIFNQRGAIPLKIVPIFT